MIKCEINREVLQIKHDGTVAEIMTDLTMIVLATLDILEGEFTVKEFTEALEHLAPEFKKAQEEKAIIKVKQNDLPRKKHPEVTIINKTGVKQ